MGDRCWKSVQVWTLDDGLQMMASFSRTPSNWTEPSWLTESSNQTVSLTLRLFLSLSFSISLSLSLAPSLPSPSTPTLPPTSLERPSGTQSWKGKYGLRKKKLVAAHFYWSDLGSNSKPPKHLGQSNIILSDLVSLINWNNFCHVFLPLGREEKNTIPPLQGV